ncbi:uncharacterized protein LOC135834320 [Planococcus citri]|uniref:uncharacterized protein LOC135834320 n=1 Tax=Planococcus citri TaxID=170843 RepID=UPI0031F8B300
MRATNMVSVFSLILFYPHKAASSVSESLAHLNFNAEQRNYISKLKLKFTNEIEQKDMMIKQIDKIIQLNDARIKEMEPHQHQYIKDVCYTVFRGRVTLVQNYLHTSDFLLACPQIQHTIKDLAINFKGKENSYNIILEQIWRVRKERPNTIQKVRFTNVQTWTIYIHWIYFRITPEEREWVRKDFKLLFEIITEIQKFNNVENKRVELKSTLKTLHRDIFPSSSNSKNITDNLVKLFPKLRSYINEAEKNHKSPFANTHYYVQNLLPDLSHDYNFVGLVQWATQISTEDRKNLETRHKILSNFTNSMDMIFGIAKKKAVSMNKAWEEVTRVKVKEKENTIISKYELGKIYKIILNNTFYRKEHEIVCNKLILEARPNVTLIETPEEQL